MSCPLAATTQVLQCELCMQAAPNIVLKTQLLPIAAASNLGRDDVPGLLAAKVLPSVLVLSWLLEIREFWGAGGNMCEKSLQQKGLCWLHSRPRLGP